jgi:hypothetical protein
MTAQSTNDISQNDLTAMRDLIFIEKQKRDAQMDEMNK